MSVPFLFVNGKGAAPALSLEHNESGIDILTFETVEEDPILTGLRYEDAVRYNGADFRVKAMEKRNGTIKVGCRLELLSLRTTYVDLQMEQDYTDSVLSLISAVFAKAGWTVEIEGAWNEEFEDLTVEERYRGSCVDVLKYIYDSFGVCFRFDPVEKQAVVYDPYGVDPNITPILLHEDVNLREVDCKGDTYEIATRLYPYGQDKNGNPLDISSVNGGKPYVDCTTYTDMIYPRSWEYDKPTTAKGLLAAVKRHIRKVCVPQESYQFDVIDLYRIDPVTWKHFQLEVGTVAHYYDRIAKQTKRMQVTKIIDNGTHPENTVVEITYRPITGGVG